MKRFRAIGRAAGLAMAAALGLTLGCETSDSPDTGDLDSFFENNPYVSDPRDGGPQVVQISPETLRIGSVGQQGVFRATGGTPPYSWDVSIPANGSVSKAADNTGVYTATAMGNNNVIVYDRRGHAAIASINAGEDDPEALAVSTSDGTLDNDGDKAVLTATGGSSPYSWSVSDAALGSLDSSIGSSVVYTRSNQGDNAVRVTDAAGTMVNLVIQQP
jgi:hypothetical protein